MDIIIWILLLLGVAGAILPALPGPILSAVAIGLAQYTNPTSSSMWLWVAVGVLIFVFDYFMPSYLTKKGGASKRASNGAMIGLVLGLFTGPGIFIMIALGAFIGEFTIEQNASKSAKAALFALAGILTGIVMKLVYCIAMIVLFSVQTYL